MKEIKNLTPKIETDVKLAAARLSQSLRYRLTGHGGGTKWDITNAGNTGVDITTPVQLKTPANFHQRVQMIRRFYERDGLFQYLIDRLVHYGCTKTRIRAVSMKDQRKDHPRRVRGESSSPKTPRKAQAPKTREEQDFWDEWSRRVNMDVDGMLPGLDRVKAWSLKNLWLDGMNPIVVEIGTMKFSGKEYIVPTKITALPAYLTVLNREITDKEFIARERIYVNTTAGYDIYNSPLTKKEIEFHEMPEVKALRDFRPELFNKAAPADQRQYGFVVKYNHSPSDPSKLGSITATKPTKQNILQTHGLYPNPPFTSLQAPLTLRQQGESSDLAILDAIINQILLVKVGDERHDIVPEQLDSAGNTAQKGTLGLIADLLSTENIEHMMQLILPYYVDIAKIETDTESLVAATKYLQPTLTIYSAFGVFIAPPQVREEFSDTNRTNMEELLECGISHHTEFMQSLMWRMVQWNPSLSNTPTLYNLPTNTKTEGFLTGLDQMRTRGEISHQTLLDHYDLNPKYEMQVIEEELASGKKDMLDENVPLQFVQQTSEPGDEDKREEGGGNKPGTQGKKKTTGQSKPSGQRKSGNQVQKRPRKAASQD